MSLKKSVFGILLLPFCAGFLSAFSREIFHYKLVGYGEIAFLSGALTYTALHFFVMKPRFLSTLAHEVTHVLWGLAFKAQVKELKIRGDGGYVNLSKANSAIRLAPYFFPTLTVLALLTTFFLRHEYLIWVYFFVGFTLALHIISAWESLTLRQPDIMKSGVIFSLPLIFIANLIVIIFVLKFIFPDNIDVMDFIKTGFFATLDLVYTVSSASNAFS
jgi:hypothetical protein